MAVASAPVSLFVEIKDAYATGKLPISLKKFNITSIISYFLNTHADFRSIREVSYELFTHGHVSDITVREDLTAAKFFIKAECIAHMRQRRYNILIINSNDGDILQANCGCADGKGPHSTCKHVAALCYALEDFVKQFILPEDIPSCTDKLEAWNKPRDVKLPGTPIFDIDFTRQKFGKQRKQKRQLQGPEHYQLNTVCPSDKSAVADFLTELNGWSEHSKKSLLLNTTVNEHDAIETSSTVNPLYNYMAKFSKDIEGICSNNDVCLQSLRDSLKVNQEEQDMIESNTLLQSRISDWFTLRKYRITGSIVHRICNHFKYRRADPLNIVKSIMQPSTFISGAMKRGLELEPDVLEKYQSQCQSGVTLKRTGLRIDTEYGFLAASPDSCVLENGTLTGLVEVKTKISDKWSNKTMADCVKDSAYPVKCVTDTRTNQVTFKLKETDPWYYQIQLQLFVCRSFAQFCDLALFHKESKDFRIIRIKPNKDWVDTYLSKFQHFFDNYMAPEIILRHKVVD